jgi:hypothetical protein
MNTQSAETSIAPLSKTQRWSLALCAVLTEMNDRSHDALLSFDGDEQMRTITTQAMIRDWGVSSRDELLAMIERMETDGHNSIYIKKQEYLASLSQASREAYIQSFHHDQWRIIERNLITLDKVGIAAWDEGRCANLCHIGMALGWLSKEEGWEYLISLAKRVQPKYDNWYHYATSYIVGRQCWRSLATKDFVDEQIHILRGIIGNPSNPWNALPWNLPLD